MKILFEDKHIIAVEKPQNCPIQRDQTRQRCLMDMVIDYFEFECGISNPYIGLVHRLDRHTGGVVVFAKTEQATRTLNSIFVSHFITKRYLARVEGRPVEGKALLIDYLTVDSKLNKTKIDAYTNPSAKKAKLSYVITQVYETEQGILSDLSINLFTGRQHQIRAQMANLGHPVLGDEKYGSKWPNTAHVSMALWATELKFDTFGKHYHFESMPPESGIWLIK